MNATEENKVDYSIEQLQGTPFTKVKSEKGWFLALGKKIITPETESEEELEIYMENNMYNIVFNMVISLFSSINDNLNEIKN